MPFSCQKGVQEAMEFSKHDAFRSARSSMEGKGTRLIGMSSANEQAYCEWYARRLYAGKGEMVELGCWLGALTKSLAWGLRKNGEAVSGERKLHVYDNFRWTVIMQDWVVGSAFEGRIKIGENYQELFQESIREEKELVNVHEGDLTTAKWSGGGIEFLLVDSMKSMLLAKNILIEFFPPLMPEAGYILHQDYHHFFHGWIHVSAYLLRDYMRPVYQIPESTTMIFKCERPIPLKGVEFPSDAREFSEDLIRKAFDWNLSIVSPEERHKIAAAKTMMFVHRRQFEEAKRLYRQYTAHAYADSREFRNMRDYLKRFKVVDLDADRERSCPGEGIGIN